MSIHKTITAAQGTEIKAKVNEALGKIEALVELPEGKATDADIATVNRTLGKDLSPASQAVAETVQLYGKGFGGRYQPEEIRSQDIYVKVLEDSADAAFELGRRLREGAKVARVGLASTVLAVYTITDQVLQSPLTSEEDKGQLGRAARPMMTVREGRKADIRVASATTRAKNLTAATVKQDSQTTVEQLSKDNRRLVLENQYLAGVTLRPADVTTPVVTPVTRGSELTAPTPAAAPRATTRRKTGR